MKDVIHSVFFGLKELLRWNTMKYALTTGLIVTLIWIGIGSQIWDTIIGLGSRVLEWIPFSLVRANGAWMLSSFLWLQLVLLTFALVFAFFGNIILQRIPRERYTAFSIAVIAGSALFWGIVWLFRGEYIYQQFLRLLTWLPFETLEKGIAFLIGFYLIYNAIIVTILFVTSLFSEPLIRHLEKQYFPNSEVHKDHLFRSIGYTIKDSIIFIVVSIIAFPLLFVPVLNILVQLGLWMWLIKNTISYDAATLVYDKVDPAKLKQHRLALWSVSFVTALFNFVPLLNLFGPYFGEITLFHYLKTTEEK